MLDEVVWAGVIGGLFWLDRYQIGQLMISRPIVVGPAIGWAIGNAQIGLAVGALFEILWLRRPPIGGFIAPEATFATAVASATAVIVGNETHLDVTALALLSFILFMPFSFLGSRLDLLLRIGLGKLAIPAQAAILDHSGSRLFIYFFASAGLGFIICFVAQVPIIFLGVWALRNFLLFWPEEMIPALKTAYFSIPVIGALDMLAGNFERVPLALFLIGLVFSVFCFSLL